MTASSTVKAFAHRRSRTIILQPDRQVEGIGQFRLQVGQCPGAEAGRRVDPTGADKIAGDGNANTNDAVPVDLRTLGMQANLTLLDTNFKQRMNDGSFVELKTMVGQANRSYNLALFYEKGPVSARLAYNYVGMKLTERVNTATAYRNRYDGADKSLDVKATYRLDENWGVTLNGWNITKDGRSEYMGWRQELPMVVADFGSAWLLGFTYRN